MVLQSTTSFLKIYFCTSIWTGVAYFPGVHLITSPLTKETQFTEFLIKKNSLRFPCRERPCLEEKSPVNVKSHRNVLSGNLNQISGRKMENHTLLDTEIHKARQKLMFLRDFQIYTFISSTFEDNFFKE